MKLRVVIVKFCEVSFKIVWLGLAVGVEWVGGFGFWLIGLFFCWLVWY